MALILLQAASFDLTVIIAAAFGFLGTVIGVVASLKANRAQTDAAVLSTEVDKQTAAAQAKISETEAVLEAWKQNSVSLQTQLQQANSRIDRLDDRLQTEVKKGNDCEIRCARLEAKLEMFLSTGQLTDNLKGGNGI